MCLALYNEIPRLKGATGSLKDAGGQDVSIKDSKNILRRGCVQGFAELEFIALDQNVIRHAGKFVVPGRKWMAI